MEIKNPKTYKELEEIGFDEKQINQLLKAYERNIDLELVVKPDLYSAEVLRMARRCARPHHNVADLHILLTAIRDGCDLSFLEDKLYGLSGSGIVGIIEGVKYGYSDIKDYIGHQLSYCQLKYVVQGMDKALPLKYFYNRNYTPREIKFIVDNLDTNPLIKTMMNKKLKIQTIMKLVNEPDLIKFCNSSTIPDMIDAYKKLYNLLSKKYGVDTGEVDPEEMNNWNLRNDEMEKEFKDLIFCARAPRQIKIIAQAIDENLDYKKLHNYNFTAKQMSIFLTAMKDNVDITPIMKKGCTNEQLDAIRAIYTKAQKTKEYKDFDVQILFDNPQSDKDMRRTFKLYKDLIDLKMSIDVNKLMKDEGYENSVLLYNKLKDDDLFTKVDVYKKYGIEDKKQLETNDIMKER